MTLHHIDGKPAPSSSGRTFVTENPATGETIGRVAFGEREDVERAVSSALRAFHEGSWSKIRPAARAATLREIAACVRARAEEIARLDSLDSGKPITDARNSVGAAVGILEFAATIPEHVRGHVYARETGML